MKNCFHPFAWAATVALLMITNVQLSANNNSNYYTETAPALEYAMVPLATFAPLAAPAPLEPDTNTCWLCATSCTTPRPAGTYEDPITHEVKLYCDGTLGCESPCYDTGNDQPSAKCCFDVTALFVLGGSPATVTGSNPPSTYYDGNGAFTQSIAPCVGMSNGKVKIQLRGTDHFTFYIDHGPLGKEIFPAELKEPASSTNTWSYTYELSNVPSTATLIYVDDVVGSTTITKTASGSMTPLEGVSIGLINTNPAPAVCEGVPLTINGTSSVFNNGTWCYTWTANKPSGVGGSNGGSGTTTVGDLDFTITPTFTSTTTTAQTVTINFTATYTGTGVECPASQTVSVIVYAPFNAGTITAETYTDCYNTQSTRLIEDAPNNGARGGNGTYTYQWWVSTDGGTPVQIGSATTASTYLPPATTGGTYRYIRQVYNACGSGDGWEYSAGTVVRTVRPQLDQSTPTLSPGVSAGPVCNGIAFSLTGGTITGAEDNPTPTYQWQRTWIGGSDYIPAPSPNNGEDYGVPAGETEVRNWLYRRVVFSCNTSSTSTPATVTVLPAFTAGAIASPGETFCSGDRIPATIGSMPDASGGDENITYQWYKNGVAISGATTNTYTPPLSEGTASTTTSTTYTRWASDGTCNKTLTQSTGTWVLTVSRKPKDPIPPSGGTITWCGTDPIPAPAVGGIEPNSGERAVWSDGSSTITFPYSPGMGDHDLWVMIYNANGSCTSNWVPVKLKVSEGSIPTPDVTGKTRCGTGPMTFSVVSSDTDKYDYIWKQGDDQVGTGPSYTPPYDLPIGITEYTLEVHDKNVSGCLKDVGVAATVTPNPEVLGVTSAATCSQGSVQLQAVGSGEHKWYNDADGQSEITTDIVKTNTGSTYTATVNASTTYYVAIYSAAGCSSTLVPVMAYVNTPPTAATVTSLGNICFSDSQPLTFRAQGGSTYEWVINEGSPEIRTTSDYTITATGPYTATVRSMKNDYINTGVANIPTCYSQPASTWAEVFPLPTDPISTNVTPHPSGTVCEGELLTFVYVGPYIPVWTPLTSVGAANANSYTFSAPGPQIVQVYSSQTYERGIAGAPLTCTSRNPTLATGEIVATLSPPSFVDGPGTVGVCNQQVVLSVGQQTNVLYEWYKDNDPNPLPSNSSNLTIPPPAIGAYTEGTYTVKAVSTKNNSCKSDKSVEKFVRIENRTPGTPAIVGDHTACGSVRMELASTITNATSYAWYENGSTTPMPGYSGTFCLSNGASGYYSYTVRAFIHACSSTPSAEHAVTITPSGVKAPVITTPTNAESDLGTKLIGSCDDDVILKSNPAEGATSYRWLWRSNMGAYPDEIIAEGGAELLSYAATVTGYYGIVALQGECPSTLSENSLRYVVIAKTPGSPVFSDYAPLKAACNDGSVSLSVTPSGTTTAARYEWFRNGSSVQVGSLATYAATATGSYSVVASNNGIIKHCTSLESDKQQVIIVPQVNIRVTPQTQTAFSGKAMSIQLAPTLTMPSGGTMTYNWSMTKPSTLTSTVASSGTANPIAGMFTYGQGDETPAYTVTFSINASYTVGTLTCPAASIVGATVTVTNASDKADPDNQTICSGSAATISLMHTADPPVGHYYKWAISSPSGVVVTGIGQTGSTDPTDNSPAVVATYTNTTNEPQTVIYTFTPVYWNVNGYWEAQPSITANVIVMPVVTGSGLATTVCSDESINVAFTSPLDKNAMSYTWTMNKPAGLTVVAGSSNLGASGTNTVSGSFTNTTNQPQTAVFTVTPHYTVGTLTCHGAPFTVSVTVQSAKIEIEKLQDIACSGDNTGQIRVIPVGTDYVTYDLWRNGLYYQPYNAAALNNNIISGLPDGTYTIQATDRNGCVAKEISPAIILPPATVSFDYYATEPYPDCNKNTGNAVIVLDAGGTPPYKFELTNGMVKEQTGRITQLKDLPAGVVLVTIIDAKGCRTPAHITIPSASAMTATATNITPVTCYGGGNGSFTINVADAKGQIRYDYYEYSADGRSWSAQKPFTPGVDNINLRAGIYRVSLTDRRGDGTTCNALVEVAITQPASGMRVTSTQTNVSCYGEHNGAISVFADGGIPPYTYTWKDGASTHSRTGLTAGSYEVTVSAANGFCTTTLRFEITQPAASLTLTPATTTVTAACNNKATLRFTVNGGTAPYTYTLNGAPISRTNLSVFGNMVEIYNVPPSTNMPGGNHTVSVIDAAGCSELQTFTVKPSDSTLDISNPTIVTTGGVNCTGNNGAIKVEVNGGEPWENGLYEFQLNDNYPVRKQRGSNGEVVFDGLGAGTYTITVRDAAGCEKTLLSPPLPAAESNALSVTVNVTRSLDCYQGPPVGEITIVAAGGTGPYSATYTLQPSGPSNVISSFASSVSVGNLAAGYYEVIIEKADGCRMRSANDGHITQPDAITFTTDYAQPTCPGAADAKITITDIAVVQGSDGYQYSTDGVIYYTYTGNNVIDNLPAGVHRIFVRNIPNGCVGAADVIIPPVDPITILTNITSPTVGNSDGAIIVTANGGTSPYEYSKDLNYYQPGNTFDNLSAGAYYIGVKDGHGCTATTNSPLILSDGSENLTIVPVVTPVGCADDASGGISLSVSGGSGNYSFTMNSGDPNSWKQDPQFTGLQAGHYTVYVRDEASGSITAVPNIIVPNASPIQVIAYYKVDAVNHQTSIEVLALGGTGAFQYSLNGQNWQAQNVFTSPAAGMYVVHVKDDNGCENSSAAVVVPSGTGNTTIGFTVEVTDADNCNYTQKVINVTNITGGSGTYQYSTDNGNTWINISGTSFTLTRSAGNYQLKVRDNSTPTKESPVYTAIVVISHGNNSISFTSIAATSACYGMDNGQIAISANGGVGILQYSIDGVTYSPLGNFSGLRARAYTVSVRDANGCLATSPVTVTGAARVEVTVHNITNATDQTSANGSVIVSATGGNNDFSYSRYIATSYQPSGQFTDLFSGNYTFYAKDGNGCMGSVAALVGANQPQPGVLSMTAKVTKEITCYASTDGIITVQAYPTTGNYSYSKDYITWQTSGTFSGLAAGNYVFYARNAAGAEGNVSVNISAPAPLVVIPALTKPLSDANANDAEVTVTAVGGMGNLQYRHNNNAYGPTNVFGLLQQGAHTFTARDASACTASGYITIGVQGSTTTPQLTISASVIQPLTCNQPAKVLVTANGGTTGNYTFLLNGVPHSDGTASYTFEISAADTYNLSVSSGTQNSETLRINITAPTNNLDLQIATISATSTLCYGANEASVTLEATGGNGVNRWYRVDGGEWTTGRVFHNLAAGNHLFEVKDEKGCVAYAQAVVTEPPSKLSVSAEVVGVLPDISIRITATGGATPYQYAKSINGPYAPTNPLTGYTVAGEYMVYVKDNDGKGCLDSAKVVIGESGLNIAIARLTPVICHGGYTGEVRFNVSGGSVSYQVSKNLVEWEASSFTFTGLPAGEHTFHAKDKDGRTVSIRVNIPQPDKLEVTATLASFAPDGTASVNVQVAGGTPAYYYSSDGIIFGTGNVLKGYSSGLQTVYVRDLNNTGCLAYTTINIPTSPDGIMVSAYVSKDITCEGFADAEVTVLASNGAPAYQYSKTGETGSWVSSNVLSGFTPGAHNVYVRDANGRVAYTVVMVKAPQPLRIETYVQAPTAVGATDAIVTINVVQGAAPFNFSKFSNSGWQASNVLTGFGAGLYTVYAKDANNCAVVSASGIISDPSTATPGALSAFASVWQHVTCYGADNGIIKITATGGSTATSYYEFSLDGGSSYTKFDSGNSHQLENRAAGAYSILVRKGTEVISLPLNIVITQPVPLSLTAATVAASCYGYGNGQVSLNATGGTGYKEYSINGAEWTTANVFANLFAGVRTAYVRDAKGCLASTGVTITQPSALTFTINAIQPNNKTVIVNAASGGVTPYQYSKDASVANSWGTNRTLTGFAVGNFTVYAKDANNCMASQSGYMSDAADANDFSAFAKVSNPLTCSNADDAEITITATPNPPASGSYSYSKDDVDYSNTTGVLTGFPAGMHTVYVKKGDKVVAVTADVLPIAPLRIESIAVIPQITINNSTANVNITATGGTAPLSYSLHTTQNSPNNVITSVPEGAYVATVTDKNGCTAFAPVIVSGTATDGGSKISISADVIQGLKCYGDSDAQIAVTATGASGIYQYSIGNGWITADGTHVFTGLNARVYTITVRDVIDFNKATSMIVTVAEPTASSWTASAVSAASVTCYGEATGQIEVNAMSSNVPLLYSKDRVNWIGSSTLTGFAKGVYTVFVKDSKDCVKEATATVSQPAAALAIAKADVTKSIHQTNGAEITVLAIGGMPSYSYTVDNGTFTTSDKLQNVPDGMHTVTVQDANECIATTIVPVSASTITDAITSVSAFVVAHPKCYGDETGEVRVTVTGGIPPYTYDNGIDRFVSSETMHTFSGLAAGVYLITVTDAQGSALTKPVEVVAPAPLTVIAWGSNANLITAQAQGGTPQYSYSTDNVRFVSSNVITDLPVGAYYVYAKDDNGCKARTQTTIEVIDTEWPNTDNFSVKAEVTTEAMCSNDNKATITLTVMGGEGAFVFAKENNESSYQAANVFTGLVPGNYTFYAKSTLSGRVKSVSINVGATDPLTLSVRRITPVSTPAAHDGEISLLAEGGRAPYEYAADKVNNGAWQGAFLFRELRKDAYTLKVRDAHGCEATVSVVLNDTTGLSPSVSAQGNVSCYGGNDGWAEVYVTGGNGNYSYSLDNYTWQSSRVLTGLTAGVHTLYVKDNDRPLSAQIAVTITQPSRLQLSAAIIAPVDPTGSNTAEIRLSAQGGTPDYHYADMHKVWDIKRDWTGLAAGYHTFHVQDANHCEESTLINIGDGPAAISISAAVTKPLACFGEANAEVTITAFNGKTPYQYSKDGRVWITSNVLKGFTAGIHTVYVRDASNSIITTSVTIEEPTRLSAVAVVTKPASAAGVADAEVKFMPTGGTAPYEYSQFGTDWQTSDVIFGLGAGTHVFYVRDANKCAVVPVTVSIGVGTTNVSFSAYVSGTVDCFGQSTGEITVIARGGDGTFDVSFNNTWTNGVTMPHVRSGLAAGTYSITVRSGGVTAQAVQVVIAQPAEFSVSAAVNAPACYGSNNGSVIITATGGIGTQPSDYLYSRMGYDATNNPEITGLSAGTYVFFVRDAAGCQKSVTVPITQPTRLEVTATVARPIPFIGGTAEIEATGTGGTPGTIGYHYSKNGLNWSYGATPHRLSGYEAGAQKVFVRDANDCVAEASLFIGDPSGTASTNLSLSAVVTRPVSCFGQSDAQITIAAKGGVAPYSYSKTGATGSWGSNNVLTDYPAGEYRVYVKDAGGNIAYAIVTVQPVQPVTGYAVVNTVNNSAAITVIAEGGSAPYNYSITPNVNRTGNVFSPVSGGTYRISLSDANNCASAADIYVSVSSDPNGVNLTASVTDPLACTDGATAAITAFATGGTSPYGFSRNGGPFFAGSNSYTFANLVANIYTLQAKDAVGSLSGILTVPVVAGTSTLVINGVTAQINSCYGENNGMLTISAAGGMPALQYSIDGQNYQLSNTFATQQLQVGVRYVYVKDALGCEKQGMTVIAATPQQLQLLITSLVPPTVAAPNTGIIVSEAAGGTPAYIYTLGTTNKNNGVFTGLTADTYTVVVTDSKECTDDETVVLGESPNQLSIRLQTQNPQCYGSDNGSITAVVTGGTMPYEYSLDGMNYQSSNVFTGLLAGEYTLYARDAQATPATVAISVTLVQPQELKVTASVITPPSADGSNDMKVLATATGGQAPYNYEMADYFNTTGLFNNLGSGSYIVIARDDNECEATATLWAQSGDKPSISLDVVRQPLCADSETGIVRVLVSGGEAPYRYSSDNVLWTESNIISRLGAGQQAIYVKEANGRVTAVSIMITAPTPLSLSITAIKPATDNMTLDGGLTLKAIGGTPVYSYAVNDMNYQRSAIIQGLGASTYAAYVADANGCRAWVPVMVNDANTSTQPCRIAVWAEVNNKITCSSANNAATVTVHVYPNASGCSYSIDNINWTTDSVLTGFTGRENTVYVKNALGCTSSLPVVINQAVDLQAAAFVTARVSGDDAEDGEFTILAIGGTGNYTYAMNGGNFQTSPRFGGLGVNTYNFTVRDANGCEITIEATMTTVDIILSATIIEVTENEDPANYTVRLSHEPTATVNLRNNANIYGMVDVMPPVMTYTTANWNTQQLMTVAAVDNDILDGERSNRITTDAANTADNRYAGIQRHVLVRVHDDDYMDCARFRRSVAAFTANNKNIDGDVFEACLLPTETYRLGVRNQNGVQFEWTIALEDGIHHSYEPVITQPKNGTYSVTVIDKYGCKAELNNLVVRFAPVPGAPVFYDIPGMIRPASGKVQEYSVHPEQVIYSWEYPDGWKPAPEDADVTKNSLSLLVGKQSGNICVAASDSVGVCPTSAVTCIGVAVQQISASVTMYPTILTAGNNSVWVSPVGFDITSISVVNKLGMTQSHSVQARFPIASGTEPVEVKLLNISAGHYFIVFKGSNGEVISKLIVKE